MDHLISKSGENDNSFISYVYLRMDKRTPPMLRNTFSLLRRADIEFHQLDTDSPIMLRRWNLV